MEEDDPERDGGRGRPARPVLGVRIYRLIFVSFLAEIGLCASLLDVRGLLSSALQLWLPSASAQGLEMPRGVSLTNQLEYSWASTNEEPTLENWSDLRYTSGAFTAGLRAVAFQPPDTTVTGGVSPSHFDVDYRFLEVSSEHSRLRAGSTYALFGHGLTLNAYEERDVRVDTNLEGVRLEGRRHGFGLTLLSGTTVFGSAEDKDRRRGDRLHGADLEYAAERLGVTIGGSAVRLQADGARPQNLVSARAALDLRAGLDRVGLGDVVYGHGEAEYVEIARPDLPGYGLYVGLNVGVGPVDILAELKDYDQLVLANSGGIPYNLPPALLREHTYTLLNRHPHVLDPDDEKGFQVEGTLTVGSHQLTANYAETRNQNPERDSFNYFDEAYGELDLALGARFGLADLTLVTAGDYQKSFLSPRIPEDEPYRELWTNIHELRVIADDRHSFRVQFEHQRNESDAEGRYDSYLTLLEWSRAPNLTLNVVGETSNRSELQTLRGQAVDGLYGVASVHISEHHDINVLYGRRLAGFVCVGGVCREEPELEGVEVRLLSRF